MTLMKRRMLMDVGTFDSLHESLKTKIGIEHADDYNERKVLKRLQKLCATKDKVQNRAIRECAKTWVKATTNMATTTL